jgi:hypothetical protein
MIEANPRRAESLEVNEAEDGLVVYDPDRDMVHHLNPSASVIFELCDGTRDVEAIARILAEAYSLDAPPTDDAFAGLRELVDRGLVQWDDHR